MSDSALRAATGMLSCASAPCMSPSSSTTLKPRRGIASEESSASWAAAQHQTTGSS